MMMWAGDVSLADLWHPKRANERQLPTNTVGRRARLDDGSGAFLPVAVACNERPVRGTEEPFQMQTLSDREAPIPGVHAIEPPGSAPRSLSSYPGQSHFPLLWAAELRISVIQTRLTFQNSGPVNSNFPVRLLR